MSVATITLAGRAFMAKAIKEQSLHIAWGSGDEGWDALADGDLPGLVENTALVNELGRRLPSAVGYVKPDDAGAIIIPIGQNSQGEVEYARYSQVDQPTAWLYIRCNFDNADAANAVIREIALFGATALQPGLPPGQSYFAPGDIADPGFMVACQIVRPSFGRSPSVRESYEFVLPV